MPKRKDTLNSTKVRAQGLINGARVVRGPDWDWGNQDGKSDPIILCGAKCIFILAQQH